MRNLIASLLMAATLTACLPSDSDPGKVSQTSESPQAQMAATSLMNTSVSIARAVVNSDDWKAGRLIEGPIAGSTITTVTGGSQMGTYAAALCVIDSKPHVLTWIDSKDASGTFKPQNASVSTGAILGSIAKKMSGGEIGRKGTNGIALANSTTKALAGGCAGLAIPADAPVILSKLANDTNIGTGNLAVFAQEVRQIPCENGKQGVIIQSRSVSRTDKNIAPSNWADISNSCTEQSTVELVGTDKTITNMTGPIGGLEDNIAMALKQQLGKMSCTNASLSVEEKTTAKDLQTGKNPALSHNGQEKHYNTSKDREDKAGSAQAKIVKKQQISTCDAMASISPAVSNIIDESTKITTTDTRVIPCAGPAGTLNARLGIFDGTGATSPWTGVATFIRSTDNYDQDKDGKALAQRKLWEPADLNCNREDTLSFTCAQVRPPEINLTDHATNADLVYKRAVKITSYADKKNLRPSAPDLNAPHAAWKLSAGSCQWTKHVDVPANCGRGYEAVDGKREYTIVADALDSTGYTTKDHRTIVSATCKPKIDTNGRTVDYKGKSYRIECRNGRNGASTTAYTNTANVIATAGAGNGHIDINLYNSESGRKGFARFNVSDNPSGGLNFNSLSAQPGYHFAMCFWPEASSNQCSSRLGNLGDFGNCSSRIFCRVQDTDTGQYVFDNLPGNRNNADFAMYCSNLIYTMVGSATPSGSSFFGQIPGW